MRVLITGGAGFIGSHLARALVTAGHQVILYDNLHPQVHPGSARPLHLPAQAELIVGDVRDRRSLHRALAGVEAVYHLAALTGVGQSMYQIAEYTAVNIGGTAVLLDILANEHHTVKRLILASSRAIYGEGAYDCARCGPILVVGRSDAALQAGRWDPVCPHCAAPVHSRPTPESHPPSPRSVYAANKLAQEELVQAVAPAYGVEAVILRFFNVYGPGQSLANPYTGLLSAFFTRLQAGRPIELYEDGLESRDFVHVDDAVRACLLALEEPAAAGETFNIGSGQAATVLEIALTLSRLAGHPDLYNVSGRFRVGDIRHGCADITKARRLLGYSPQVSLSAGLLTFLDWATAQQPHDQGDQAESELAGHGLFRQGTQQR